MRALETYFDDFANALLQRGETAARVTAPLEAQPGFAVYRNTFLKASIDALEANYPAVARLVGGEWFRAAAARFVLASPPIVPMLAEYGEGFAAFLEGFAPAREIPYLAATATLDRFWTEAHLAPDARALDAATLSGLQLEQLRPHPAARWRWFDDLPAYSIWRINREELEPGELQAGGEGGLITRPHDTVLWRAASRETCLFLDACAEGRPLGEAAARALEACEGDAEAALTHLLGELFAAGAFR